MNKTIKNIIGIAGIIAGIIVAVSVASYANTYSKSVEPSSYRSFSVSAEGEAVGIPDIAEFTVGVVTEGGTNIGSLQEENTGKTDAIISYIKENGVEDKDIKTSWYDISPRYNTCYDGVCPPRQIVGYTISSSITVKARDFEKAGEMLSGVVSRGANDVSGLTFKIDDPEAPQKAARDEAIAKAKVKAEELAKSAGFKVGRLLSITDGYSTPYYSRVMMDSYKVMSEAAGSIAPVALEPGSQDITSSVTLVYEIR